QSVAALRQGFQVIEYAGMVADETFADRERLLVLGPALGETPDSLVELRPRPPQTAQAVLVVGDVRVAGNQSLLDLQGSLELRLGLGELTRSEAKRSQVVVAEGENLLMLRAEIGVVRIFPVLQSPLILGLGQGDPPGLGIESRQADAGPDRSQLNIKPVREFAGQGLPAVQARLILRLG